ncbi:type II toxin-antitoxin system Phd/YefM family antitoxin [Paenibacillus sp. TRM 82003]|nr:type II toxin-antitoxin system Phd/YefM family antitoxin [Paenibacillus sp. TRM 82003]
MRVPSTEVQNNFGKYVKYAEANEEIIVTKNGKDVAKLVPCQELVKERAAEYRTSEWVTYEEYLELVENSEQRFELIDGVVYNLTSPSYKHQHAVHELHGAFYNWFKGKPCTPLTSPFDVTFLKEADNICVVQPDLLVICDKENIGKDGKYRGNPTVVVEVLSPSTRGKDMLKKLDLYKRHDVREYWVVDPMHDSILVYSLADDDIADSRSYQLGANDVVSSVCFPGLEVPLRDVFYTA